MSNKDLGLVTAYGYAKAGGYTGTENQFKALLGNVATDLGYIENLVVNVTTLAAGSSATSSYSNGVLSLGIPRGDTGEISEADLATALADYTTTLELETLLEGYAKVDGSYDSLTAGNAKQLVSTVRANDKVPYNFRTSGGSVDIGDREYINAITGGSLAWNQLIYKGNFADDTGWIKLGGTTISIANNECSFTTTANYDGVQTRAALDDDKKPTDIVNHKYFISADIKASENTGKTIGFGLSSYASQKTIRKAFSVTTSYATYSFIGTQTTETVPQADARFMLFDEAGSTAKTIYVKNIMAIDLTQMFGSTIADYIYTLETNHAGDGVAWFKKLFPKPYYAYDSGSIQSVKTSKHKTVGFNAWDEVWEVGDIRYTDGQNDNTGDRIRSKNYISVVPSTTYYCNQYTSSGVYAIFYYDADKAYLGHYADLGTSQGVFTTPTNCAYIRFRTYVAYGTTYNHDICINLHWDGSRDGEYEPYSAHEYALDSDLTLRGIPKLDANNSLHYDGDTYESDGTVTRKYGVVDLGSLTWSNNGTVTGGYQYLASISDKAYGETNMSNVRGYVVNDSSTAIGTFKGRTSSTAVAFNSIEATPSDFKTSMDGVYLVYELATPTTETADSYQSPQIVDDFGTEEYVDTRDVAIPVGHDTDYPINILAKVEMAPDSPSQGNGDYIVRQTNGVNAYVPLVIEDALPQIPSSDGTYTLTVTVEGGESTLSWES